MLTIRHPESNDAYIVNLFQISLPLGHSMCRLSCCIFGMWNERPVKVKLIIGKMPSYMKLFPIQKAVPVSGDSLELFQNYIWILRSFGTFG